MIKNIVVVFFCSVLFIQSAFAGVIYIDDLTNYGVANPLVVDSLESDGDIFLLEEQQNYRLTEDLAVEQLVSTATSLDYNSGHNSFVSSGTVINSFLFHYDAVTASSTGTSWTRDLSGSFTFDTEIIAVIWSGPLKVGQGIEWDLLGQSDYLAGSQAYFPNGALTGDDRLSIGRGLEPQSAVSPNDTKDDFIVSADLKTINVNFKVMPQFADQLRIITAEKIPEPTAILLFGTALCLFGFRRFS